MTISDLSLFGVALIVILYRAWAGWRYGATNEMRFVITNVFALLLASCLWRPCAQALIAGVTLDPRWVTTGTFVALFALGGTVAGFVVRAGAKAYQSVKADYVNQALGLCAGLFTGAIMGGSLLWLATVASPEQFAAAPAARALAEFPASLVRGLETRVAGVDPASPGRLKFPRTTLVPEPVETQPGQLPEGAVLMRMRGEVTWL